MKKAFFIYLIIFSIFLTACTAPSIRTESDVKKFFNLRGYEIDEGKTEKSTLTFPKVMDNVYLAYYELQKKAGNDISPYLGKEIIKYTVIIKNYKDYKNIVGNVFVYKNKVIASDILNPALDGFLIAVKVNN